MIPSKVISILFELMPMIILFSVVMILIRVISTLYAKEKIVIYEELKNLLYTIYCFTLFYLVTTSDFESFSNNFIPFKEIMRYDFNSMLFLRNVIGNILIFIPFGFLISDMIYERAKKINIFVSSFIIAATSFTIELVQKSIGRSFDIDDIILNFIGGFIGYLLFKLVNYMFKHLPPWINNRYVKLALIILLIVLAFIIFLVM